MIGPALLRATAPVLVGLLAVLSVFTLLRGHYAPGGGFAGGLILASAVAIQLLAHGPARARQILEINARTLAGIGLIVAAISACIGPVLGRPLLAPVWGPYLPSLSRVGSVMLFDIGVYLVVAGTAVAIFLALVEEG